MPKVHEGKQSRAVTDQQGRKLACHGINNTKFKRAMKDSATLASAASAIWRPAQTGGQHKPQPAGIMQADSASDASGIGCIMPLHVLGTWMASCTTAQKHRVMPDHVPCA
jgi:hypothetical protein